MPVWITKKLRIAEWGATQFRVELVQHEMGTPLHLAMLRRQGNLDQPDDVYIVLPDERLMERFPDFVPIAESDIPHGLTMLVGTGSVFAKRFPDLAKRLKVHEP